MKRNLLWRGLLILGILAIFVAGAYPLNKKINLGLDLRGGMHMVLQVHTEDALRAETDGDLGLLQQQAQKEGIPALPGHRVSDTEFEVTGLTPETRDKVTNVYNRYLKGTWEADISADRARFTMRSQYVSQTREMAVTQAKQTIDNRINAFGVTEPVIQEASNNRILVELPGVDDPERVKNLIKNTAFLEFRIVRDGPFPNPQAAAAKLTPELEILPQDTHDKTDPAVSTGTEYWLVDKLRTVTGRDLKTARPSRGGFTEDSAQDLATVLRSGALPASFTYLEERTVGPSLGSDSIRSGVRASVVGT